ncbi:hypothetical protein [Variovorax sp. W2I14]|uniref:hypothetical protein n=1 Tax=Variovorax sp. W2I14 TaxID=3042290 RepID=UPI003D2249E5
MMKVARKHRGLSGSVSPYADGGLFSLAAPGRLVGLLTAAGYAEVAVQSLAVPFELPDAAAYVAFVRSSGSCSPIMEVLAPLDAKARESAWREVEEALEQFRGELRFGIARRPEAVCLHRIVRELLRIARVRPWDVQAALRHGDLRAQFKARGTPIGDFDETVAVGAAIVTDTRSILRTCLAWCWIAGFARRPDAEPAAGDRADRPRAR